VSYNLRGRHNISHRYVSKRDCCEQDSNPSLQYLGDPTLRSHRHVRGLDSVSATVPLTGSRCVTHIISKEHEYICHQLQGKVRKKKKTPTCIQSSMQLFSVLFLHITTCVGLKRTSSRVSSTPKLSHCIKCIKCSLIYNTSKCEVSCLICID
jgi:hypothetical protein